MDLNIVTVEDAKANIKDVKAAAQNHPSAIASPNVVTPGKRKKKSPDVTADDMYGKLVKIVPAPLAGAYAAAVGLLLSATDISASTRRDVSWALFAFFLVAVMIYLKVREVERWTQYVLTGVAFVSIAMVTPGPFTELDGWSNAYGSIAVLLAGTGLVVFQPNKMKSRRKKTEIEQLRLDVASLSRQIKQLGGTPVVDSEENQAAGSSFEENATLATEAGSSGGTTIAPSPTRGKASTSKSDGKHATHK